MNISVIQFDISAGNTQINLSKIEKLHGNHQSDLVILPEMFNTGYVTSEPSLAESMDGVTLNWMIHFSQKHKTAICGSILCSENDKLFNRFLLVSNGEIVGHYDKIHLFGMAQEAAHITAGNVKVDMVLNGFKIRPAICYDLRFPYMSFNDTEYDILLNVASWPSQRIAHWDALLQARAIENQAYVIGCNRVGAQLSESGKTTHYPGHSAVYAPDGAKLNHSHKEEVMLAVIDKQTISNTRNKMPFLNDRRM